MLQSGQLNIHSFVNGNTNQIQNVRLFTCEELRAYLVVVPPGSAVGSHVHENSHELFDVVEGEGVFEVEGRRVPGRPGQCVFVPAGAPHSLRNDSEKPWTLRVTYQDRVYPRHLGKLIRRAVGKRIGWGEMGKIKR